MDYRQESGLQLEYTGSFDLEKPEERYMSPRLSRLRNWLSRVSFSDADVSLIYRPGIFIYSEISCDDRDSGQYESHYIKTLLPLPAEKAPGWSNPSVNFERSQLRPLSEPDQQLLEARFGQKHLPFQSLLNSYVSFINERNKVKIFHNKEYRRYSSFSESMEEFKQQCIELALVEKSDLALQLSTVFDREVQQLSSSMLHALESRGLEEDEEEVEKVTSFISACKRLLNKAISLHVLDVNISDEASVRWTNYGDTLRQEVQTIVESLDRHQQDFNKFAANLIERFSKIKHETNQKALAIESFSIPLSSCSMRILRIEKVWLPFWNIRFARDGKFKERTFKAH